MFDMSEFEFLGDDASDAEFLRQREHIRRQCLAHIAALQPGDPAAEQAVTYLISVEGDDENYPIGDPTLTVAQVRDLVPRTALNERFFIVRDQDIPEPWRERFNAASIGSTRLEQGAYGNDWLKFLQLWEREMAHFEAHRKELPDD